MHVCTHTHILKQEMEMDRDVGGHRDGGWEGGRGEGGETGDVLQIYRNHTLCPLSLLGSSALPHRKMAGPKALSALVLKSRKLHPGS